MDGFADGGANLVNIAVKITSPTTATAYAEHWVGNMGAGGTVLYLKKLDGKGVVVKRGATWIS